VLFIFDNQKLDTGRRELRRGGLPPISMEPQVFDLLVYLVQNQDRVVSKDDLIASVWSGRIVSESTLGSRINAARKAVGDNGKDQRLIRTIPRRGFRFVGAVDSQSDESQPTHRTEPAPEEIHEQSRRNIFLTGSARISSRRCPSCAGSS
jgi:DNA-binding winged helix-turn-helix (wHTH) protein